MLSCEHYTAWHYHMTMWSRPSRLGHHCRKNSQGSFHLFMFPFFHFLQLPRRDQIRNTNYHYLALYVANGGKLGMLGWEWNCLCVTVGLFSPCVYENVIRHCWKWSVTFSSTEMEMFLMHSLYNVTFNRRPHRGVKAESTCVILKVPKREIFDRSDFPYFYTIKSSWAGDL